MFARLQQQRDATYIATVCASLYTLSVIHMFLVMLYSQLIYGILILLDSFLKRIRKYLTGVSLPLQFLCSRLDFMSFIISYSFLQNLKNLLFHPPPSPLP